MGHRGRGLWLRNTSIAALALLPATIVQAQAVNEDSDRDDILVIGHPDTLTVPDATGSRLGLTPLETPASIAIITGDEIRARGDINVQDAVSRAPGIANIGTPGDGNSALAARGFAGQGSVLQLGRRHPPVPGRRHHHLPTDVWNIERVEVLSGPASVLYGQGALGGAVNVITKKPDFMRTSVQAEAGYGSQNTWHLAAGAGGPISDVLAYRVDASYRNSDGYVDRGDSKSLALSAALAFRLTDNLTLTLRDDYGDLKPMKYYGTPLVDSRLDTAIRHENYNVANAIMHWKDNRTLLTLDWAPSEAITVTNTAYRLTSDRRWQNAESYCWIGADGDCPNFYGGGTPGEVYRTDYLGIRHDQEQIGNQGSVTIKTPLGGSIKNDLVVGFDVNRIKLTYSHDFPPDAPFIEDEIDLIDPDVGLYQGVPTIPRYKTRTDEYALFAEDRVEITEQLSIIGGIRYERDKVQRRNIVYNADGSTSEVNAFPGGNTAKILHNTTWRVGAVYQPTPAISLYGQYATGVDPLGTLTTFTANAMQFYLSNATGHQIEAGVKASFLDGRGSATLAAYKLVKNNLFFQLNPRGALEQIGQRSSKGVEASLQLALPAGFGIDANGTVLDANFDDFDCCTGKTPAGVPETLANLWLTWDAFDRFQARAGLRYVGRRFSDNDNTFRVPSYTVVDGGVSYALTDNVALDFRVYNLFDKDYAVSTYNHEQWILGRPRSVDFSVRARF